MKNGCDNMIENVIDRELPVPAYYQIEMDLKERIARGEWTVDQQLPSEAKLAEYYAVSRITLRQALAELEKDGIIRKKRGKGAFICENPVPFVHSLNYALVSADKLGNKPYNITAETLTMRIFSVPNDEIRSQLQLTSQDSVLYFKRLFYLDGNPIAVGRSWLKSTLVPNLENVGLINNQLSTTLKERYGIVVNRIDDCLEVVRPTQSECHLLGISYDCPLMLVRGISYTADETPVEYSNTLWLGDRVRFNLQLSSTEDGFKITSL